MALNYLEALSEYFPGVEAYCTGDATDYTSLVFTKGSVTQADMDAAMLQGIKVAKIIEMSQACEAAIVNGFVSSALGVPKVYDSDRDSQMNLIGVAAMNSDYYYSVRDPDSMVKTYELHTAAQIKQVLADGAAIKLGHMSLFNDLRNQIYAMTTIEEVNAVTWPE